MQSLHGCIKLIGGLHKSKLPYAFVRSKEQLLMIHLDTSTVYKIAHIDSYDT